MQNSRLSRGQFQEAYFTHCTASESPLESDSTSLNVMFSVSSIIIFATLQTVPRQAPLSMAFSRQGCWSGLPCPSPGDLPDPGVKLESSVSPALQAILYPLRRLGSTQIKPTMRSHVSLVGMAIMTKISKE